MSTSSSFYDFELKAISCALDCVNVLVVRLGFKLYVVEIEVQSGINNFRITAGTLVIICIFFL